MSASLVRGGRDASSTWEHAVASIAIALWPLYVSRPVALWPTSLQKGAARLSLDASLLPVTAYQGELELHTLVLLVGNAQIQVARVVRCGLLRIFTPYNRELVRAIVTCLDASRIAEALITTECADTGIVQKGVTYTGFRSDDHVSVNWIKVSESPNLATPGRSNDIGRTCVYVFPKRSWRSGESEILDTVV